MTGGAGVAAFLPAAVATAASPARFGPHSPQVAVAAQARQSPGARTVALNLEPAVGPVEFGARTVTTWSYGGVLPGKEQPWGC